MSVNTKSAEDVTRKKETTCGSNIENETAINDDTSAMFEMIETRKLSTSRTGTQIRLRGLDLHENTATVKATSLTFTVQCSRCKNREELSNVTMKYVHFVVE